jgi:hypothetical protein
MMMMMQGPRMANGAPHPGGQMGMPPQMGGMSQMNHPQMGHPGGSQNVIVSICSADFFSLVLMVVVMIWPYD